jgi:pyridoxine/pyridoxamine 5'-phosphate oxidase
MEVLLQWKTMRAAAISWTLYALRADEVEFWQADHERRHIRKTTPPGLRRPRAT